MSYLKKLFGNRKQQPIGEAKDACKGTEQEKVKIELSELAILTGHSEFVHCATFSPDGKLLATASRDKTIKLWEIPGGCQLATFEGHTDQVLEVTFSPDGSLLASRAGDKTARL